MKRDLRPGPVGGRGWIPEELLESAKSSRVMQSLQSVSDALSPASRGRQISMGYRLFRRPQVLFLCVIVFVCLGLCDCGVCGVVSLWVCGLVFCGFVCVCVHMLVFVWVLCVFV